MLENTCKKNSKREKNLNSTYLMKKEKKRKQHLPHEKGKKTEKKRKQHLPHEKGKKREKNVNSTYLMASAFFLFKIFFTPLFFTFY